MLIFECNITVDPVEQFMSNRPYLPVGTMKKMWAPNLFLKFLALFIPEVAQLFEAEKHYKNTEPPTQYQCSQCGEPCSTDVHSIPSPKNEHGHRILCNYCWSWREATHEAVKRGQLKLRQE
jgi:DNA-directed RNA polymerase subunit RPC12/RpoP